MVRNARETIESHSLLSRPDIRFALEYRSQLPGLSPTLGAIKMTGIFER